MLNKIKQILIKKAPVVAIDIGASSIKLIELAHDKQGWKLLNIANVPTPPGSVQEGTIKDRERLEQALVQLLSLSNCKTTDVILTFNGKNVVVRQLRLPIMPEKEIKQAVEWEMEKYLPIQRQELHMDYLNFGEIQSGANKQLNILVAAVQKDMLYTYYEVFSKLGLDLVAVDVLPLALWHAVAKDNKIEDKKEATVILELGSQATTITVFRDKKLAFTRTIPIGGKEIDKSVAMMLMVAEEEAKLLKEKHGILEPIQEVANPPEDIAEKLQFAIKGTLKDLMQEIQRSINFYQVQDKEAEVNKVLLVGGLANLNNIDMYINNQIGIPVEVYSPAVLNLENFEDFTFNDKDTLNPVFVTAFGLARRGVE